MLVLRGLGGGDVSPGPLRWFLERLGYRTHGWGLGTNTGRRPSCPGGLGRAVSVVGWSLGRVYATAIGIPPAFPNG